MADDDDTSAGLTPETRPAARRRASRRAGPPVQADTPGQGASDGSAQATPPVQAAPAVTLQKTQAAPAPDAGTAAMATAPDAGTAATATALVEPGEAPDAGTDETTAIPAATDETTAAPRRGRALLVAVVAGILVVVLAGVSVWLLVERNNAQDRDAQRNAYVQAARQTVLNLTTIKPDTAKDDVDRILAGASGEFASEFDGREDPFVSVVQEAGVTTVGKILEAGLESEDGNSAKVLVAARADVSTPDGTQDGPRDFRMRVTVTDDGGNLTASKVEFVP